MMRQIVSFSLFNNFPLYINGAIKNAELIHSIYPGWVARFYVDHTVPNQVTKALVERGAEIVVVDCPSLGPQYGRYWRFWVAGERGIDRFIVRDVDSWLNTREAAATQDWIASGRSFHVMRDSYWHSKSALGGMWGAIGYALPNIRELTDRWGKYSIVGECDQFVSEIVFPLMAGDYLAHDSYSHFADASPFPPHDPMSGTSFVGEKVVPEIESLDVWRCLGEHYDHVETLKKKSVEVSNDLAAAVSNERATQADLLAVRAANEALTQKLRETTDALDARVTEAQRLIDLLEFDRAPRSLRLVLPLAKFLRKCSSIVTS